MSWAFPRESFLFHLKSDTGPPCPSGFIEMQGALPVIVNGEVIGAIGVSADTKEHDAQIAQAGLAALPH
jgi:uncharacterized protein GlcG (DUF336 family)